MSLTLAVSAAARPPHASTSADLVPHPCLPHPCAEDELIDEEAEELRDGDVYEDSARLGTLPSMHTPQHRGASEVGSLLGDEFTSPHAGLKKGD